MADDSADELRSNWPEMLTRHRTSEHCRARRSFFVAALGLLNCLYGQSSSECHPVTMNERLTDSDKEIAIPQISLSACSRVELVRRLARRTPGADDAATITVLL